MRNVLSNEYNSAGIGNLEEAISVVKEEGIATAREAVSPEIVEDLYTMCQAIGLHILDIPGIGNGVYSGGVSVRQVLTEKAHPTLVSMLDRVESRIAEAANGSLPDWQPTKSPFGVRVVSMRPSATFGLHTDDKYEGLVASIHAGIDGEKTMVAIVGGKTYETVVQPGDITLLACRGFTDRAPLIPHGSSLTGMYAVAFTLGQDPTYRIRPEISQLV